ncbi:MAG TPA: excinuclease ABC subunit UvrA [Myxococcaceae bacterium]|nr:excinuclease ABC subunit UvrA [Myxococcaceae bacterium]
MSESTPQQSTTDRQPSGVIEVRGARENSLKGVSLDILKHAVTVFTGVSGSGKSSLVFDTIAAESQRLLNETFPSFVQTFLPKYGRPDVDSLAHLSATVVVDQGRLGGNSRSTVGTVTDTAALLRLVYARAGSPPVGGAASLSFNDPQGMCPACEGLGRSSTVRVDALVDPDRSLNEGAIRFPTFNVGSLFWLIFAKSGFFDLDKKVRNYTSKERQDLLELTDVKVRNGSFTSTYEGLLPKFKRLYLSKDAEQLPAHLKQDFDRVVRRGVCEACNGARLNEAALGCRVLGKNIGECSSMEVSELAAFLRTVKAPAVATVTEALIERLSQLDAMGLGYLSLARETSTLSGGESQRVKMVRHLGSSLTDLLYVFDEPSVGLHPHDVDRLTGMLRRLCGKGNTVLVVDHKPAVIEIADQVVDMGPGAGTEGGRVVYQGGVAGLKASGTVTGQHLARRPTVKTALRKPEGYLSIEGATRHNLSGVSVRIPQRVLTVVTGVAGSGKSSLVCGILPERYPEAVLIDQSLSPGSRRSNLATYTGMLDVVRKAFAGANRVSPSLFSANSKGACPACQGLGVVYADLAHLDPVATPCEACGGRRFTEEVLGYTLRKKNISDVLGLTVSAALEFFIERPALATLSALSDVGLGYLTLGQPLNTLSGGERQRLKLANELAAPSNLYVLDEPTAGLHMSDVGTLMRVLDRLVDGGGTVVVIEHNLDVIARADWIIDMGPGAGREGGRVVFQGTPLELAEMPASLTGRYLARSLRPTP